MTTYTEMGWQEVDGVRIGNITSVHYDVHTDTIRVIYINKIDQRCQRDYGAKSTVLSDMMNALQEYWNKRHEEQEKEFERIWVRIDEGQQEALTE